MTGQTGQPLLGQTGHSKQTGHVLLRDMSRLLDATDGGRSNSETVDIYNTVIQT